MAITCSIVGASGYIGGELLRLLLTHPGFEVKQVTSESKAGRPVHQTHPNLRKQSPLKFSSIQDLEPCDVLCLALPHGIAKEKLPELEKLADVIVDLSEDHRLDLNFVYGHAELNREALKTAQRISGAGCNPTSTILALKPFYDRALLHEDRTVVEAKISSSAAGNKASAASHHPERSGCVRSYKPTGHRHIREICHYLGTEQIHFSVTAIEMVRGILMTAHLFPKEKLSEKDIWQIYREAYSSEPFIRIVKDRRGIFRMPEPKLVAGTNFCDIGFEVDETTGRIVVISAIDNLTKGSAGHIVQALNLRFGFDEKTGLEFFGLHPV